MPMTTAEPSLTTLTEAMWPLVGLLRKTRLTAAVTRIGPSSRTLRTILSRQRG